MNTVWSCAAARSDRTARASPSTQQRFIGRAPRRAYPLLWGEMSPLARVRQWLLAVLVFELVGAFVELLLLRHFEDLLQWVPLVLIVLTLLLIAWHVARPQPANVRALQVTMGALIVAGVVGVGAHLQGAAEFQLEMDPSQPRWNVFK